MHIWYKQLEEVLCINKYEDSPLVKYTIESVYGDGKIDKIINKHLLKMFDDVKIELEKIKKELKELCKKHNNFEYDDGDRKIINEKIYYKDDDEKWIELNLDEEGLFEEELYILKADIK